MRASTNITAFIPDCRQRPATYRYSTCAAVTPSRNPAGGCSINGRGRSSGLSRLHAFPVSGEADSNVFLRSDTSGRECEALRCSGFPARITGIQQRVLSRILTAFPLHPSRSLRASGNLCRREYTQKLRGMEINLFDFHSRSATVYVERQRQIYAFPGLITLISEFC